MNFPRHILSFDAESNGLHGEIFAIGAVVIPFFQPQRQLAAFRGYCKIPITDRWVQEHVMPHISDLDLYASPAELREEFWKWLTKYQHPRSSTMALCDVAFPVESRLLTQCVADQIKKGDPQKLNGPYPLHELATLLYAIGEDPIELNRREWPTAIMPGGLMPKLVQHNPFDDALAAAWCAVNAFRILEEQRERLQG